MDLPIKKDYAAMIMLAIISFSMLSFYSPKTLGIDSYSLAIQVEKTVQGKASPSNHAVSFAAFAVQAAGELEQTLILLPVFLGIVSILSFYLLARSTFNEFVSLSSALMLLATPSFSHFFAAGFFTGDSLSLGVLAVFAALLVNIEKRFLQALRPYSESIFPIVLVGYSLYSKNIAISFTPLSDYSSLLLAVPLAAALIFKLSHSRQRFEGDVVIGATGAVSLLLLFYFPPAAVFGLAFCCAFGIMELSKFKHDFKSSAILFGVLAFFASLALLANMLDFARASMFSLFIAGTAVLLVYLYKEKNLSPHINFFSITLVICSLFFASLFSLQQTTNPLDENVFSSLKWIEKNTPENSVASGLKISDAITFVSKRKSTDANEQIARFLFSNSSTAELKSKGVDYLLVDARVFDDVSSGSDSFYNSSKVRLDSFAPTGQYAPYNNAPHAVFFSPKQTFMLIPVTQQGQLLETTVIIQDAGQVSFGKLLFLNNSNSSRQTLLDRYIYPKSGFESNLFKLFFPNQLLEKVAGAEEVYKDRYVRVFRLS